MPIALKIMRIRFISNASGFLTGGLFLCVFSCVGSAEGGESVQFNRDIRPLLSDRCFHCHGPDGEERKGELRLDRSEGEDGAYRVLEGRAAILPGSPEQSEVWTRLVTEDPEEVMPPPDSHKKSLTEREKGLIRRWIEQGAEYEDFWAFVPPVLPGVPRVKNGAWSSLPVDHFVMRRLEEEG